MPLPHYSTEGAGREWPAWTGPTISEGRAGGGASIAPVAGDTGVSEPAVGKYLRAEDLSERPREVGGARHARALLPDGDARAAARQGEVCFVKTI